MRALILLAGLLVLPLAAKAQTAVELRARPVASGAGVTLGDLFEGPTGPSASVVVARAAPMGQEAVLDAGEVQLAARRAGVLWDNPQGFRRIVVASAAAGAVPAASTGRPRRKGVSVLVWARNLSAGELITAEDLRWSAEALEAADGVSDPDHALGKAARRPLREGDAAALHDLVSPRLVRRDDPVNVVYEADGVSLTLQGKALADAGRGQILEVMNPTSKKIIEAVCSGPDQALVGPQAEALKAAAASDPLRYASLR